MISEALLISQVGRSVPRKCRF